MSERVTVKLPGDPEYVGLARVIAAEVAARSGLDHEEIDELRIVVSEACTYLIRRQSAQSPGYTMELGASDDGMVVTVEDHLAPSGAGQPLAEEENLGLDLMRGLTDEFAIASSKDGGTRIRFARRPAGGRP
jgi:serine/threonine-protein kinase RsbW